MNGIHKSYPNIYIVIISCVVIFSFSYGPNFEESGPRYGSEFLNPAITAQYLYDTPNLCWKILDESLVDSVRRSIGMEGNVVDTNLARSLVLGFVKDDNPYNYRVTETSLIADTMIQGLNRAKIYRIRFSFSMSTPSTIHLIVTSDKSFILPIDQLQLLRVRPSGSELWIAGTYLMAPSVGCFVVFAFDGETFRQTFISDYLVRRVIDQTAYGNHADNWRYSDTHLEFTETQISGDSFLDLQFTGLQLYGADFYDQFGVRPSRRVMRVVLRYICNGRMTSDNGVEAYPYYVPLYQSQ